ncbi:uncharacterized protein [Venturia canescens]|uniref:uncharacterized protein isoform X2 n=1 Tax=Venturia canescens TaxID=32260 RepID=UPI001C9C69BB|nr:uncharacterized protein LOC122406074 isoform X2 [Venturia canescens]
MLGGDNRPTMAGQCRYFEQHAWKREICTNCFKTREEHLGSSETSRPSVARASANLKTDAQKLQSILRANANCQPPRRKNVAFQESLTEVIGYGGNDFSDSEDNTETDEAGSFELSESGNLPEEDVPDSEEDRALGNLTRANTNFNTVTANLTDAGSSEAKAAKSFASLMLGKVQKDSEGKKKTLLVSVTPFGADDTLPTAKRPSDKKATSSSVSSGKTKQDEALGGASSKQEVEKAEPTLKNLMKSSHKSCVVDSKQDNESSGLEKIVDMPLITSSNLISVIQKSDALTANAELVSQKVPTEKRGTSIARCPAIKKPDSEKPKIVLQTCGYSGKSDYTVTRISKVTGLENSTLEPYDSQAFDSGVDLNENLGKSEEKAERASSNLQGKDINKIQVPAAALRSSDLDNLEERTVEGEAGPEPILLANRPFSYEESREKAGEPDGKADEEELSEPPALPRTSPPTDSSSCRNMQPTGQRSMLVGSEPRTSFLHGEIKAKPALPYKPISLPAKPPTTTKNAVSGSSSIMAKNGGYVIVPPPVKNASNPMQSPGRLGINDKSYGNDVGKRTIPKYSLLQTTASLKDDELKTFQAPKESKLEESPVENCLNSFNGSHAAATFKANGQSIESRINGIVKQKAQLAVAEEPESPKLERTSSYAYEDELGSGEPDTRGDISADSAAELIRSPNKRRMAPKPPATMADELPASIFARNPAAANLKSDSPVVREKEKRERASSCSPKFRKAISEAPDPCGASNAPEAAPRRTISLSQGSLANVDKTEEKKKSRPRFSLKRLLRMGTRKDVDMTCGNGAGSNSRTDEIPTTPQPKPRLEIIHPLELDGAAVEVLRHDRIVHGGGEDVPDSKSENAPQSPGNHHHVAATRPGKPPPPPRNVQSPNDYLRLTETSNKPIRPPPPRNEAKIPSRSEKPIFSKTWQPSSSPSTTDSIYANLGEVRSGLAPSKPQRTASMRDQAVVQPPMKKRNVPCDILNGAYEKEDAVRPPTSESPSSNDSNGYECLSSSPECDSNLELRHPLGGSNRSNFKRKSDSSAMDPCHEEFKYHQPMFARSTSLPYCGSETESELYAPYSFYTGDEGPEEDQDWKAKEEDFGMNRVRQRRGRSIVHRSLEDNYGAVIVANHEALAQLLERLNQPSPVPANLRSLKTSNPRLNDFDVDTDSLLVTGKKVFCSAVWNEHAVTLCLALDTAVPLSGKEFCLTPVTEFVDVVPEKISLKCFAGRKNVDAFVSVFARMQVNTVQSFAVEISRDEKTDVWLRASCFVLLQLVNALKNLQARGIEEASKNLGNLVLCREDKDTCYRLYMLRGLNLDIGEDRDEERVSLCRCALVALQELGLEEKLPVIRDLLMRERAVTLSQVKSVLEFSLWGPSDAMLGVVKEREMVLQRWLDLERANVLHALVRTSRLPLTVTDEYQLIFLVRTSARAMCEASVLLDEQQRVDSIRSN